MANRIKYGAYWISIGITVTGVLWFNRPDDKRVLGEDYADLFEAVQERYVIPYLEGEAQPDYTAANGGKTNSIDNRILYSDILVMASRTRELLTQNSHILWSGEAFSAETVEPAKMFGSYAIQLSSGQVVDTLNSGGVAVTNRYYSYVTNTFCDVSVTTATRMILPPMKFVPWITTGLGYTFTQISTTNLPVSGYVFSGAVASNLYGRTSYTAWPFDTAYEYPWEQWSCFERSRVVVRATEGDNLSWTNVAWISTNSLSSTFTALASVTNHAGYSICTVQDVNGHDSVPFVFIYRPKAVDGYYDFSGIGMANVGDWTKTFPLGEPPPLLIAKSPSASWAFIRASIVAGDGGVIPPLQSYGTASLSYMSFANHSEDAWAVIKYTAYASSEEASPITNVAPIYAYVRFSNSAWVGTNIYFDASAPAYIDPSVTILATSNAVTQYPTAKDDMRINLDKLNGLYGVLTNMNRTIYFGGAGTLVATNQTCFRTDNFFNGTGIVQYVSEFLSNYDEPADPEYYDWGSPNQYINGYIAAAGTDTFSNSNHAVSEIFSHKLQYVAKKEGSRFEFEGGGGWESYTSILASGYEKLEYEYKGVSTVYPSVFAITNGYVKKVTVYAVYSVALSDQPAYLEYDSITINDFYAHDVGGNYWTPYNTGLTITGKTLSTPSEAIPDSRLKFIDNVYDSSLRNRAIFCKIAEIDNPTAKLCFDINKATVNGISFGSRNSYSFVTNDDGIETNWDEQMTWDYSGGADIKMTQFLIVVDWDFKHLGNGFIPQNNNPAWRQ